MERANQSGGVVSSPQSGEDRKLAKLAPKRLNPSLPNLSKLSSLRDSSDDEDDEGEAEIRIKPILKKNKFSVSTNRLNPFSPMYDPGAIDAASNPKPKTDTNPFRNRTKTPLVLGEEFFASLCSEVATKSPHKKAVTFTSTKTEPQTNRNMTNSQPTSIGNNRSSVAVSAAAASSSSNQSPRTNPPIPGPSPFTPSWPAAATPSQQPVGVSPSGPTVVGQPKTGLSPLKPGVPSAAAAGGVSQSRSVSAPPKKPEEDKYAALKNLDDLFKSSATIQDSKLISNQ